MVVEIKHAPAFATLFVTLLPGESIIAEADAMASRDMRVRMRTRVNGNWFTALLRRIFGGESFFINEFYIPEGTDAGTVVLTQDTPGDVMCIDLTGQTVYLQPGAFVACGPGVQLDVGFAGFASWFGGEGLFRLKVSGYGPVYMGSYGASFYQDIRGQLLVDTGHILAYEPGLSLGVALPGGVISGILGGEGFMTRVTGHGRLYLQSRSIESLADWTDQHLG